SEEGHGTTIKIYIPRSDAAHQDRVEQTLRNKVIPGGDETILLVEDEDGVRDVAISLLSSIGYDVLHADCGSRALEIISERDDIDLLFTDIVMPGGMNGTELAQLALEKNPKLRVLYTSGYTGTTVFDNELLEHGSEMLNKPYRQEELAQSVRNVLDRDKIHDT
ncbi:MAG: response regulator, partial [Woeseiaceae bacterium]|nr:response regulator [Woeseiaceae bacterium]